MKVEEYKEFAMDVQDIDALRELISDIDRDIAMPGSVGLNSGVDGYLNERREAIGDFIASAYPHRYDLASW